MSIGYKSFHENSIRDPKAFWSEQAKLVDWHQPFSQVLDYSKPPFAKWFVGGQTNLCHNAVDRHLNAYRDWETDRKSTRLNSSHSAKSRMPSSA